jgi:hypothetical protein
MYRHFRFWKKGQLGSFHFGFHQWTVDLHVNLTKYDKQDQQGKAAFNERNPHMTQQQEPMARSQTVIASCIIIFILTSRFSHSF